MDAKFTGLYMASDALIESDHPLIIKMTKTLANRSCTEMQHAENIFYFIRDSVRYTFIPKFQEDAYRASNILQASRGFCTQKAILFCALARCAGIPAGLHFYDIIDHTLSQETVNVMQTNTFFRHGIAELYIDGKWCQFDATLDKGLIQRKGLIPVEFDHRHNCLMADVTITGHKHIEYVRDYGMYAGVTFDEIMAWFSDNYPNLDQMISSI